MKWLAVSILIALAMGTIYLSPSDQHVKKFFNNGLVDVIDLGSEWKVVHKSSQPFLGYAYWDLYIPEASKQDVVIKITFSQSQYRAWLDVYCAPKESFYVWMNGITSVEQYEALSQSANKVFSSKDMGEVHGKTVEIKIPKGNPWVRIMVLNNDVYNKGFYVTIQKAIPYSTAESSKLVVQIVDVVAVVAISSALMLLLV